MGPDRPIADIAREQEGVFSRSQALACGATEKMIVKRLEAGRWESPEPGIYVIRGAQPSWRSFLHIAAMAAGRGSAVSHRSAAVLHDLGSFGQAVEITTPRRRRFRTVSAIVHTSTHLSDIDIAYLGALPVTTPARTLIDLGAVVHPERVEDALDVALRDGLVHLEELRARLRDLRKRGRRGCGVLARILEGRESGPVPESRYERLFLRAIRRAGLPDPQLQVEIRDGTRVLGRVDCAWPRQRVAVEIDGHRFHATRQQRARDAERENAIKLAGWQVVRFTTDQVWEHPEWVALVTGRALALGSPPSFV